MSIAENIARVRASVDAAARRAGRTTTEVTLMAVSKTFPANYIREAYDAGIRIFGENRVQEFAGKADSLRDLHDAEFHLIGHLQSNKASKAAEIFGAVDSVDSVRLARRLDEAAARLGKKLAVLIEINVGGEEQKSGLTPTSPELDELLKAGPDFANLQIRGFMTIPPYTEDPEGSRPYFRALRELRDRMASRNLPGIALDVLSMGMSHDFEVAVTEGSTCLRVGTAIFGARAAQGKNV
jgi:pyridoxal phosphate enzyme (YggS family)